jgi:hypothetical protein
MRTYLNSILISEEVENILSKLENIIVNFSMHTIKVFPSITISDVRLLVESMCRCSLNKDENYIVQQLLA